jgi:hypothetical protein
VSELKASSIGPEMKSMVIRMTARFVSSFKEILL